MKRAGWALVLIVVVGIVAGLNGAPPLTAQQEPVKRQVLEKFDLGDKDGVMYVAEIDPGASTGKHFHHGPEAVYVLQGSGTLEMEGHPPKAANAGEGFAIPGKHIHEAKNASAAEHWKLLVFLAGDKGQPIATPVTPPYFWKQ
jgi:quercetin dioxygenase-like cupin family protein